MGSVLLALAANRLLGPSGAGGRLLRGTPLPAAVGALLGVLFVLICSYGEQHIFIAFPAAFMIWQAGVGLALQARTAPEYAAAR